MRKPVVLGSSFGGNVALTYAGLFPDYPGGVILASTTGGRSDQQRVIEAFGRLGGPEAAAVARRTYADETGDYQAEFNRVCYPLYSSTARLGRGIPSVPGPDDQEHGRQPALRQSAGQRFRPLELPAPSGVPYGPHW